jgi:hypothetical protein
MESLISSVAAFMTGNQSPAVLVHPCTHGISASMHVITNHCFINVQP